MRSTISWSVAPFLGKVTGAYLGFLLNSFRGLSWGWRNLRVHPSSIFIVESKASIELEGVIFIGFSAKPDVPLPGIQRTGLVIKKNDVFKAGNNVKLTIGSHIHVSEGAQVNIGDNTFLSYGSQVIAREHISIGSHCAISWNVTILDSNLHRVEGVPYSKPVIIGSSVWIGHHVSIFPGVTIGDGVIVGASSTVTKDIPPRCLAVGSPARVIKENVKWEI